jgi:transcriptional regulator GlxA family with amidase domain
MSVRSFTRRFLAETGTSPHRWLTQQRVLRARQLLEETTLGIDTIAATCGFGGGARMRHHFHRIVGVTPADYRRTFQATNRAKAGETAQPEHTEPVRPYSNQVDDHRLGA